MRALMVGAVLVLGFAASVAAQSGQLPLRVGGGVRAPNKIRDVRPVYPAVAQSARVAGVVILEATIGTDGSVTDARILRGIPLLNDAALDAVRQWQYEPTMLNGVAVPIIMTVTVNFALQDNTVGSMIYTPPPPYTPPPSSGPPPSSPASDAFALSRGRAGLVYVGMTADQLFRRVPRNQVRLVDQHVGGMFSPALEISLAAGETPGLIGLFGGPDWRIAQIEVRDQRFRTSDGFGVGSTLAELRARDPNLQLEQSAYGAVAMFARERLAFAFEPQASGTDPALLPETARVLRVFVTDGLVRPYAVPPPPAPPRD